MQDIDIKLKNTKFRRERYETPLGETIVGQLPAWVEGTHFGPTLRAYVLDQYHEQHVTQRLILKQLWQLRVRISAGQLNSLIIEGHDSFHEEKEEILRVGLSVSSYVNVDDTGARHKGKNGYCTHIGNELFASFASTESKSRINFLELLRAGHTDYVKRRKISATTRSDLGRKSRDTFLSLKKTCQKLGISFWEYLQDRLSCTNNIPPLPVLIAAAARAP